MSGAIENRFYREANPSATTAVDEEREACIAILEDLRPKNDRSDWTEHAQNHDAVLSRAIAAITARYGA